GKGYAIGSAILTVLALFSAYNIEINHVRSLAGLGAVELVLTDPKILIGILNSGLSTGTYLIGINYTGSGAATLTTANIVSQMFLAGVTGISAVSFD
ncbi:MAG: hypothetical protein EBU08_07990, partial [Micrococcales bacterium]|nr:hypothetical protein [Micrococcales bacterium]